MIDGVSVIFLLLLTVVAFLYSSVGHGGASGYLALMALFGLSHEVMKPTALLLNIFVSLIAFVLYYRSGYFRWKIFLPLALASIPASFLGGMTEVNSDVYRQTLGVLLIIPAVRFIGIAESKRKVTREVQFAWALITGGIIGYLSGIIGIGGGILLSPLLLILGWTSLKETAAVSSLFILVNSVSGLSGQFAQGIEFSSNMYVMVLLVLTGGIIGSYFGAKHFNNIVLKRMLAVVLVIASIKLLLS
ncbi:MAG TPA: sulfite exporter TauE/SafE family protein [Bacteroidia bacterium]|nr:sulfite exporter TauE/SafE family protein [Bacteroidia bacterium]